MRTLTEINQLNLDFPAYLLSAAGLEARHANSDRIQKERDAEVLASNVRQALDSDVGVESIGIIVEAIPGGVCLRGTVPTPYQKARAEEIAQRFREVRKIKNRLKVLQG